MHALAATKTTNRKPTTNIMADAISSELRIMATRWQAGEPDADEQFATTVMRSVRSLLRHKVRPEDLDDAAQDVSITAVRALRAGTIREVSSVSAYVWTLARRYANRKIRQYRSERQKMRCIDDMPAAAAASGELHADERIHRAAMELRAAVLVSTLPGRHREVLRRFYIDGQSREEICRVMGLSGTQFRLIKARALQKLRGKSHVLSGSVPAKPRSDTPGCGAALSPCGMRFAFHLGGRFRRSLALPQSAG